MSRWFFAAAIALALLISPALGACEHCVAKGSKDPDGGGPYSSAICWTSSTGGWSYCSGGATTCTGGDPENSCPTGGSRQCITFNDGRTLCVENAEPLVADPRERCRTMDVQGRCAAPLQRL